MQAHYPVRVDEQIAPSLIDIPVRLLWLIALQQLFEIDLPCFESPDIPEGCGKHAVTFVHLSGGIYKNRPRKRRIFYVAAGKKVVLKGNHHNFHVQPVKFILIITQLRDVRPAGESAKMPVKNHQEPAPSELLEGVPGAVTVLYGKFFGRFIGQITHNPPLQSVFTNFMAAEFMQ